MLLRRHRFPNQNATFLFLFLLKLLFSLVLAPIPADLRPPNIYKWIEENAHICTIVPSNGEDLINFLSVEEGLRCALCPELKPKELPTMACAIEVSPNNVDVEIGCQPIPELCVLELKNRYAEFFSGSAPGPEGPPGGPPGPPGEDKENPPAEPGKPSEEEIFQATSNVFSENSNQLGITEINIDEEVVEETAIGSQRKEEEVKEVLDILHGRETTSTTTTTTISPTMEMIPLTTVRANVFSMPGRNGIPLDLTAQELALHSRTASPIFEGPHGPPGGGEMEIPMEMANGKGEDGNGLEMQKRVGGGEDELEDGQKSSQSCKDGHELCCFWAIAGECDANPFWMRVKCPKTCGTCGCQVKNADKCKSTGIKCVLPTKTTKNARMPTSTAPSIVSSTSTVQSTPTPPPTTSAQQRRRSRPTPPARMPGHRPQRPKHGQRTSTPGPQQKMVAMTEFPLVSGDWSAVDFGNYADEEDEEEAGPPGSGRGSSVSPLFVELSLTSTGYPDEALVGGTDEAHVGSEGAFEQTVPIEPALTSEASTISTTTELPKTTSRETCFNYHKLCDFWAKMGECSNNPFWMRPHCQRACHSCGETLGDISTPPPRPGCNNEHILCPFWAFIGECGRNPRWMGMHCLASCQLC